MKSLIKCLLHIAGYTTTNQGTPQAPVATQGDDKVKATREDELLADISSLFDAQTERKEVHFSDTNLEGAVRRGIRKPKEPILKSDLDSSMDLLNASDKKITNLNGIEHCANLSKLFLTKNQITDVSPLSNLNNLQILYLGYNQISDISPLVSNSDSLWREGLDLRDNPLNDEAYNLHIPALEKRGVEVLFDPKP